MREISLRAVEEAVTDIGQARRAAKNGSLTLKDVDRDLPLAMATSHVNINDREHKKECSYNYLILEALSDYRMPRMWTCQWNDGVIPFVYNFYLSSKWLHWVLYFI